MSPRIHSALFARLLRRWIALSLVSFESRRPPGTRHPNWGEGSELLVERMLELAIGMTNRQYRAGRLLHHALCDAAHQDVRQSGAPVSAEHDQIGALALRGVQDFQKRRADLELTLHLETGCAQPCGYLVEFLLREQALLLGDSAHRANVHRRSEFRRHHYRRERLIDVEQNDFGGELGCQLLGEAEREIRVLGEV